MPKPEQIIGIAGGSCSGKTSLEGGLRTHFGNRLAIFPFDDMFVGMQALQDVNVTDWESPGLYRWNDFRTALHDLCQGRNTTIAANSRESTEAGIAARTIEPRPLIVVAGFLALRDESIRSLYDTTIFIDLPEEEIIRRRKARAAPGSPWDSDEYIHNGLIPGHRKFVVPQREYADNVIDGAVAKRELVREIIMLIESSVECSYLSE